MEGLEGLEALGNAGAIPLIILFTQLFKKKVGEFKYGSDVLALLLSFILCTGWEFYYMNADTYVQWASLSGQGLFKWCIDQLITGFATWLAASKVYDLGHGNKKRQTKVLQEKKILEEEIVILQNGNGNGEKHEESVEEIDLSAKLREVLEEE